MTEVPVLGRARRSPLAGHLVVLLASCAAFAEQPLVGRLLLPEVGGSIVAWTTTVVFFQSALIAGYLLAGWLERKPPRWGALLLVGVLAGPLVLTAPWLSSGPGAVATRLVLIAPGYIALTAVPILMGLRDRVVNPSGNPYRLSATSNAGSLLGLALGLAATEVTMLSQARVVWWVVTCVALGGAVWLLLGTTITRRPVRSGTTARVAASGRMRWLGFSALASALLVSFTTWLGEQTVVMPLLWVVPLAIFLGVYAFVFALPAARTGWPSVLAVGLCMLAALVGPIAPSVVVGVLVSIPVFAAATWAVIRRLEASKPDGIHLASFWIHAAVGGAVGGAAATFAAPLLLPANWEAPALLFVSLALLTRVASRGMRITLLLSAIAFMLLVGVVVAGVADGAEAGAAFSPTVTAVLVAAAAVAVAAAAFDRRAAIAVALIASVTLPVVQLRDDSVVARGRNFFGSWEVVDSGDGVRLLVSNGTVHGAQLSGLRSGPSTYYGAATGIGRLVAMLRETPGWAHARVTGIGMGAGTVSAWSEPGQEWTFLEIDPDVIGIAREFFTYLADSAADVTVLEGDGRIELASLPDASQDLLILDAYQGDSVPTHLLTSEACALYRQKLAPGGAIAVHVSNRHLRLPPVVAACAEANGMQALSLANAAVPADAASAGSSDAEWVLVTANEALLAAARQAGWRPVPERVAWSDERTPLLGILKYD